MKTCRFVGYILASVISIAFVFPVAYSLNSKLLTNADATTKRLPWLHTNGTWIVDEWDQIVILRGCNYMGLEFGQYVQKETDYVQMKGWGFNVVRTPIAWSYIEPSPGVYNDSYLLKLDRVIEWCKKYGLYVLIDIHQWQWSPKFGGDGAPYWTCDKWTNANDAEAGFWENVTLQAHFINMWKHVASRYANESTVCGYDLFNEPGMHFLIPSNVLYNFYNDTIKAIRSVDPKHIIFYEPPYYFGSPQKVNQPNVVFSTHLYTYGIYGSYDGDIARLESHLLEGYEKAVMEWGIPFWVGEFGISSSATGAGEWVRDELTLMDKYMIGSAWWSYWRRDGDTYLLDSQGREKTIFLDVLDRTYPLSSNAPMIQFSFNITTKYFSIVTAPKKNTSISIYVSARHYPYGFTVSCNETQWDYSWDSNNRILTAHVNSTGYSSLAIEPSSEGLLNETQRLKQELLAAEKHVTLLAVSSVLLIISLVISNLYWYRKIRKTLHVS